MSSKLSRFLSLLFVAEHNCLLCDRELPAPSRYRLCAPCYATAFEVIGNRCCLKCGKMLLSEENYCLDCQNHDKAFDRAFSPVSYTGGAVKLVPGLKFHNKRYYAEPMARWMTDRFLSEEIAVDVVLPIPLHPNRRKERGYNQSELLAKPIAQALRLPLDVTSVVREKDTLASTGLTGGRKAREENMKGAFRLTAKDNIKDKVVLVVDDVITTGATSSEIASVIKKGGAKKVYVLCFASTREKPPIQEGF